MVFRLFEKMRGADGVHRVMVSNCKEDYGPRTPEIVGRGVNL